MFKGVSVKERVCVEVFVTDFFSLGVCLYYKIDAYTGKVKSKKEVSEGLQI